ncbi:hypothetical protein QVN42_15160 [Yersinia nurmii]|uniref:Uncharacterized protein n=1 Tax=Yersinia nurmii TaxID=685706 RepID=A0AAW7KAI5_9GAMM|nr:hypothetical protein [Yersinia nurmii]MDN0088695.1 hypothetical protein [Yersinia nurmii]
MDGCLVLIPDSDETNSLKKQYQREQISEIKLRMRELIGDYKTV